MHNARNRWAVLRGSGAWGRRAASDDVGQAGQGHKGTDLKDASQADADAQAGRGPGDDEEPVSVPGYGPFSLAKRRASELLEQARRQHASALDSLRAELELYRRSGEQLTALADPAMLDLEIATIAARAGRQVAQAEQDAADSRRAQLTAERDRDEAVQLRVEAEAAADQIAEDAEAAERMLAERAAQFERDRELLRQSSADAEFRAAEAARQADESQQQARTAEAAAEQRVTAAERDRDTAAAEAATARAVADELRAAADRDRAAAERDRQTAEREREAAAAALATARADAGRERDAVRQARDETARARAEAAGADARAGAAEAELARLRGELAERREAHAAELARLVAVHEATLKAAQAGDTQDLANGGAQVPGRPPRRRR